MNNLPIGIQSSEEIRVVQETLHDIYKVMKAVFCDL
jgi:hypothetical protein